jgi:RNA polymerase sigma factor (sigma-70 family)
MIHGLRRAVRLSCAGGLTDADLLQRWACHRDEVAFEALLWRHAGAVLGICRRVLRDRHEAEDAAQTAFLALAQKAPSIGRRQAVSAWLFTVAHRTALRARARRVASPVHDLSALPARQAEDPAWRDLRPVLDEEVSRLPPKYRAPFVLCHVEGRTNAEAARELGCPVGTVLSRLARARQHLRTRLTRRGVTLGAGVLAPALTREAARTGVPGALVTAAVRAAAQVVAGKGLAGMVSAEVVTLTEEVTRAMFLTKVKTMAAVVLGLLVLGGGVLSYRTVADEPGGLSRATPALTPTRCPVPADEGKLKGLLEQKDKQIEDLQERLKALEEALAEKTRQLEAALLCRKMDDVKDRLATGAGGPETQGMQKDVLTRLDSMIKEVEATQKKAPDRKLSGLVAELKMAHAMQKRVNVRTEVYGQEYQGEVVPAPGTGKDRQENERFEMIQRNLQDLSKRQGTINRVILEIATR